MAGLFKATPKQAWVEGTNIRSALRVRPEETKAAILAMVKGVSDYVDAKKRLETASDYILTTEMILEVFPVFKLEELRLVCDRMKTGYYGGFYERLKAAEFRKCMEQHEAERAPLLEELNRHKERDEVDPTNITFQPQSMADLIRKRNPYIGAREDGVPDLPTGDDLTDIERD